MEDYTSPVGYLTAAPTASLVIGTKMVNMEVAIGMLLESAIACAILSLVFGGLSVAVAARSGHLGIGLGTGLGLAIAMFVLYSLAPFVSGLEHLLPLNPFEWTIGKTPLANDLDPLWSVIAIAVTVMLACASIVAYNRHDFAS